MQGAEAKSAVYDSAEGNDLVRWRAKRREAEKKKPKQKVFNGQRKVGDAIAPRASAFVLEKIRLYKYSCGGGRRLTKTEEGIALRSLASSRPSKNVVNIGKNAMLAAMHKYKWSPESLQALVAFWCNLELHSQRTKPNGEQILLTYQARVRIEWHHASEAGDEAFNISDINETLMRAIADDFWDDVRDDGVRQVSTLCVDS
ncbi:hypothetical protein B0H17DRAFT_1210014 [Mycena rosella]|uniref:Uncharacterized protein n=1 Tax=Mycena rosella TaxID=1033263 RepID=A0AAD7CX32_MYCRO|nr:hypothetical protein B0H17DRAFT_1210014 [Mycena rosella]